MTEKFPLHLSETPPSIREIILRGDYFLEDLVFLLSLPRDSEGEKALFQLAGQCKEEVLGKKVHMRGLIEVSNICRKNCSYCGISRGIPDVERYTMEPPEIRSALQMAKDLKYGSVVLQSGERLDPYFSNLILSLLKEEKENLAFTLSLGEYPEKIYQAFFDAGATRYLLRIETTNENLFQSIHPFEDGDQAFQQRLQCLEYLKKIGFQVGTGVMIGLPGQSLEDLAKDLLFFRNFGIHMVGMGPYIEHSMTPLYERRRELMPPEDRVALTLKMIAILRLMMNKINIAATTALQALHPIGRERGIQVGANIIMPNLTPLKYREGYLLYEGKPCLDEDPSLCHSCLELRMKGIGHQIGYNERGDSKAFTQRAQSPGLSDSNLNLTPNSKPNIE